MNNSLRELTEMDAWKLTETVRCRQDDLAKSAKLIIEKLRLSKLKGATDPLIAALGGGGGDAPDTSVTGIFLPCPKMI